MFRFNPGGWVLVVVLLCLPVGKSAPVAAGSTAGQPAANKPGEKEPVKNGKEAGVVPAKEPAKQEPKKEPPVPGPKPPEEEAAVEEEGEDKVAVAKPVSGDPVQIFGWKESVVIEGMKEPLKAKLDTGALTSSVHAEEKVMFERDGKKWVRFFLVDRTAEKPVLNKMEAPLVRTAMIKEPGGESVAREVVRLSFQIGDRKMRGEFTLNNRANMNAPVLIGRSLIQDLGWVDAARTDLADKKIFR